MAFLVWFEGCCFGEDILHNKQGSRFRVDKASQISERYTVQMKAAMKQKRFMILAEIYFLMIKYPKIDWYLALGHKRLCYSRATAGTFILNLLYRRLMLAKDTENH